MTDLSEIVENAKRSAYKKGVIDTLNKFLDEESKAFQETSASSNDYSRGYNACCIRFVELVRQITKEVEK